MGPWSDVWSLGALLYAILYGRPPYRGPAEQILEQVQAGPPSGVDGLKLPEPLVEIWRKCMTMNPADRYPLATEVAREIEDWLEGSKAPLMRSFCKRKAMTTSQSRMPSSML
jgi:serine/threonine protein kinase